MNENERAEPTDPPAGLRHTWVSPCIVMKSHEHAEQTDPPERIWAAYVAVRDHLARRLAADRARDRRRRGREAKR